MSVSDLSYGGVCTQLKWFHKDTEEKDFSNDKAAYYFSIVWQKQNDFLKRFKKWYMFSSGNINYKMQAHRTPKYFQITAFSA